MLQSIRFQPKCLAYRIREQRDFFFDDLFHGSPDEVDQGLPVFGKIIVEFSNAIEEHPEWNQSVLGWTAQCNGGGSALHEAGLGKIACGVCGEKRLNGGIEQLLDTALPQVGFKGIDGEMTQEGSGDRIADGGELLFQNGRQGVCDGEGIGGQDPYAHHRAREAVDREFRDVARGVLDLERLHASPVHVFMIRNSHRIIMKMKFARRI